VGVGGSGIDGGAQGVAMTRDEFGWWVKGLASGAVSQEIFTAQVLNAAREILQVQIPKRAEPAMTEVRVARFCGHNIALVEECRECAAVANSGSRVFGLMLPVGTEVIYLRKGS
jgi:hypothetical protein